MNTKLNQMHKEALERKKENIVDDTIAYIFIKKAFNVPNLTPYDYAIIKVTILQFLKNKRYVK